MLDDTPTSVLTPAMNHIPTLSYSDSLVLDVLGALVVHGIYKQLEVEPANLEATFLLLIGVPAAPCYFLADHIESMLLSIVITYGLFYVTLISSIVFYRISPLHPLAKYPGPLLLKVSKFVGIYYTLNGKQYTYFKSLHDKYGPFVRTGPNELSAADVEAIPPILGLNGMRRGPLFSASIQPGTTPSLVALRNVDLHNERRKLWNHGFTSASIKELQPAVESRVLELVEELSRRVSPSIEGKENSLDLALWLSNFTYDFMGDMVFGGGLGLMQSNDGGGIRAVIEGNLKVLGTLGQIPWISSLVHKLSVVPKEQRNFQEFVNQRYTMRKEQGSTKRDLFHYITNEEGLEKIKVSQDQAMNDILIAVVGGADTASTVLSGLFFYLLSDPPVLVRLKEEVDSEFPVTEGEPFDAVKLARMPYLNAVIDEALRLQPAISTILQRSPLEGSGGKFVAGRFVPESTVVYVPPYVLHRDPRYFSPFPDSFIPERWIDDSNKFTTNTSAFIPFSTGPANCVGKNLALLEMRMVVAAIVQKFDIKFTADYDPRKWDEELQEFLVMSVGKLPVVLNLRQ
ncbi:hypothetical protein ACEPAH_2653 [Sanghuangporus vaninii]